MLLDFVVEALVLMPYSLYALCSFRGSLFAGTAMCLLETRHHLDAVEIIRVSGF